MPRTLSQSLLDRLIDDHPDQQMEPAESPEAALSHYKLGLRRDLEGLLNSKRPQLASVASRDALGRTIVAFGLSDISTEDFSSSATRDRVRRMVAQCIREHEPRLANVEVEVDGAPTSKGIRFRITATLTLAYDREMVVYDAAVRPNDRAIAVELTG